jgi:cytochrome c
MDSFELNKIAGAALGSVLMATVIFHLGEILLPHPELEKPAIAIPGGGAEEASTAPAPASNQPFAVYLAKADIANGKATAGKCLACHTLQKGQPPHIGPNLYGIIGAPRAHEAGFAYSDAMKALGGTWNFDELNEFLTKPQAYLPGTKMTFPGLDSEQDRADVAAYLNTLSDSPKVLPKAMPPSVQGVTTPNPVTPLAGNAPAPASQPQKPGAIPMPAGQAAVVPAARPTQNQQATQAPAQAQAQVPAAPAGAGGASAFVALVAAANPEDGKALTHPCQLCHNFTKGGAAKIGPDLWGVVGAPIIKDPNYSYSDALKGLGGSWSYDRLDKWLEDPRAFAPGTKMIFAGLKDEKQRAAVVAYLRSLADSPAPLAK